MFFQLDWNLKCPEVSVDGFFHLTDDDPAIDSLPT